MSQRAPRVQLLRLSKGKGSDGHLGEWLGFIAWLLLWCLKDHGHASKCYSLQNKSFSEFSILRGAWDTRLDMLDVTIFDTTRDYSIETDESNTDRSQRFQSTTEYQSQSWSFWSCYAKNRTWEWLNYELKTSVNAQYCTKGNDQATNTSKVQRPWKFSSSTMIHLELNTLDIIYIQLLHLGYQNFDTTLTNHWPLSNTLTPPSPATKYKHSLSSTSSPLAPPFVIRKTPLTSLAVPVSNNLNPITTSAWCAKLNSNPACLLSNGVCWEVTSGSSAATVRTVACTF